MFKMNVLIYVYFFLKICSRTNSVGDSCTNFTSICTRLNILGDTIDNARTLQKNVLNLVDQSTNLFHENILNISCSIDDSLEKVNKEKLKTKQELKVLENRYSFDLITRKTNLEECTKTIEILKTEKNSLLRILNEANINLNKEKETKLNFNLNFKNDLKDIKYQNELLINENKLVNFKYDEIIVENKLLINELAMMKTSLNENKMQLELQSNIIKEQTKLFDNIKIFKELNDTLQIENLALQEHNKYLETVNTNILDDSHNNKLSQNKIQEENKKKFEEMCANYDFLLKMHEEKLLDMTKRLKFQEVNENTIQNEIINLKKKTEMYNKTIINLQEEVKSSYILVPELQNKVDNLNVDLINTNKKLQDSTKEFMITQSILQKEKNEFESQNKEQINQIENLTNNYMKYKSRTKQLNVEVRRLRYQCSQPEEKRTSGYSSKFETIEIKSDSEDIIDNDLSIIVCNDQNISNMNASKQSIKNTNMKNTSTLNKNSPSLKHINHQIKKLKIYIDIAASKKNMDPNVKNNYSQNNSNSTSISQKYEYNLNNECINSIKSTTTASSNENIIQVFNIPEDLMPVKKRKKK